MATVLAFYSSADTPKAVRVPEDKQKAVDRLLSKHQGIKIQGTHYTDDQIIGLFEEKEWQNLKETLLVPPRPLKTMDDLRRELEDQDWFRKAKNRRTLK